MGRIPPSPRLPRISAMSEFPMMHCFVSSCAVKGACLCRYMCKLVHVCVS